MRVGDLVIKLGGIYEGTIGLILEKKKVIDVNYSKRCGDAIIVMPLGESARRMTFYEKSCEVISESR
jgi:hypothetical protein